MNARLGLLCAYMLCLVACTQVATRTSVLRPASPPKLQDSGDSAALINAIDQSLRYLSRKPPDAPLAFGSQTVSAAALIANLKAIRDKAVQSGISSAFFDFLREHSTFLRVTPKRVLVTGYYEPELRGSRVKTDRYRFPLYRAPGDLVTIDLRKFIDAGKLSGLPNILRGRLTPSRKVEPYYTRDEIDFSLRLAGKNLELVWIDDLVDVFFLQVQGSGIVKFEDGSQMRVNYADANGQPYRPIGARIVAEGLLSVEDVSMQSIRAFLHAHPERLREIFQYNPSYVFFREVQNGPLGSIGVPLTSLRSVAMDDALFPKGALGLLKTELPTFDEAGRPIGTRPFLQLILNQDSGGAIKGPSRVDLFTGRGAEAALIAGYLKAEGEVYFLAPKDEDR